MKTNTPASIDTTIESLKQQLANLEAVKKKQEKALKDEIARQEKLKAEIASKNKFNGWTPTKKNLISVIEMSEKQANLPFFEDLKYTSGMYGLAYEGVELKFGDGWKIENHYRHGGCEGNGSEHYVVLKVTQNDIKETFWMVPGYYESYNGGELELDCIHQVEPYEKMVIDYKKI
jgi:hypothetical protein